MTIRRLLEKKSKLFMAGGGALALFIGGYLIFAANAAATVLFKDDFNSYPNGLITSDFTFWNPTSPDAKPSTNWEMNSGALFAQTGQGYSGVPTFVNGNSVPNPTPTANNHSAIFRLTSKRANFGDAKYEFKLRVKKLVSTSGTPSVAWDGIHIFMRYQSEYNLYYASVNRRDGAVVIKKKCVGGTDNGGTYYTLGGEVKNHPIPLDQWQTVAAYTKNNADGSVTLGVYRGGVLIHKVTDSGTGCAAITKPGKTGIRGDNTEFYFDDFTITSLDTATPDTQAPAVSVTSPAAGSTVSGTVAVAANATDNVGVTKVEYWLDGRLINSATAPPYNYSLNTTAHANGSHTLIAKAYDAAGNVGTSRTITFTISNTATDRQAPSTPGNLRYTGRTQTSISLAWAASTDNVGVRGYNLYRNGTKIRTQTGTTFTDTNLRAGTTYHYTVEAYDAAGNVSPRSAALSVATLPPNAPNGGIVSAVTIVSDWDTGYCADVKVTNTGTTAVTSWRTTFTTQGAVVQAWNVGSWSQSGTSVTIQNASWNGTLQPGQSLAENAGFCANK